MSRYDHLFSNLKGIGITMANHERNEMQSVIERANQTELAFPFIPVSEQIHAHALRSPDQTAVICRGKALSYGELDRLSNRVANFLIKKKRSAVTC